MITRAPLFLFLHINIKSDSSLETIQSGGTIDFQMMIYDNLAYSYHQNQSPPSTFNRSIEEGSLNMGTSSLSSVACPVGTYHNTTIDVCQFCTKGSYQNQEGQLFCLMCRPGETSPDGATHLSQCMLIY